MGSKSTHNSILSAHFWVGLPKGRARHFPSRPGSYRRAHGTNIKPGARCFSLHSFRSKTQALSLSTSHCLTENVHTIILPSPLGHKTYPSKLSHPPRVPRRGTRTFASAWRSAAPAWAVRLCSNQPSVPPSRWGASPRRPPGSATKRGIRTVRLS